MAEVDEFEALWFRVDVLLLAEDVLDPGGVVLDEEDWEAVLDVDCDMFVVPLPRLFLSGEETALQINKTLLFFWFICRSP